MRKKLTVLLFKFLPEGMRPNRASESRTIGPELEDNESIIIEGAAKYFMNTDSVKGHLFLTCERLIFKACSSEMQTDFLLKDIHEVSINSSWGVFYKGFTISMGGIEKKFAIDYPADWKKVIKKQREVNQPKQGIFIQNDF